MRNAALLLLLAVASSLFAQVRSPEVGRDHRVTLRYFAPGASKVAVQFEALPKLEMTKDVAGTWTAQTGPLEPDLYCYSFLVDGKPMGDPSNPDRKPFAMAGFESILHIAGPNLPWERRKVPHGTVHHEHYHSGILGEDREFYVYTPPGYEHGKSRYPVLVLLHGVTETEASWEIAGKAS